MLLIDVRELDRQTDQVLQQVREEKARYIITCQGRPIALLIPVDTQAVQAAMIEASKQSIADGWDDYARIAEQMRQTWPAEQETRQLLNAIRR